MTSGQQKQKQKQGRPSKEFLKAVDNLIKQENYPKLTKRQRKSELAKYQRVQDLG